MPSPSMRSGRPKGRAISQASYELMVESHRRTLGDHAAAALAGGVTYNTARKAWDKGLGKDGKKPPIRQIIGRDMTELRAVLSTHADDKLEDARKGAAARKDMIDSKAMQARGLRMARNNGIALMGLSANLLRSLIGLSNRLDTLMNDAQWRPTPREAIALIKAGSEITKAGVDVAKVAEDMERAILGGPDIVIGVQDMSPQQAVSVLQGGSRTLARIRRRAQRGDLPPALAGTVIDVGPSEVQEEKPKPKPSWQPVDLPESSNIDRAMFHAVTSRVRVQFKGGAAYDYYGVTEDHIEAWKGAESAGTYLNTVLKNTKVHPCLKVTSADDGQNVGAA